MREWEKCGQSHQCVVVGYSMIFYQTGWMGSIGRFIPPERGPMIHTNEESCSLHVNEFWTFWPKMVIYNYPTDDAWQTSNKFWTCALFRPGGTQQRKFPGAHTLGGAKKNVAPASMFDTCELLRVLLLKGVVCCLVTTTATTIYMRQCRLK